MKSRSHTELIVIHCSDTYETMDIDAETIHKWHVEERGWSDIGYHKIIQRDGTVEQGREDNLSGAHAAGYNGVSYGVCLVGGRSSEDEAEDNFTEHQWQSLKEVLADLRETYPEAEILGHRDLDGVNKECPAFDVRQKLAQWEVSRW